MNTNSARMPAPPNQTSSITALGVQSNLINGTSQLQSAVSTNMPTLQQQQQYILQQKQQTPQQHQEQPKTPPGSMPLPLPPSTLNNPNMSKFLPPMQMAAMAATTATPPSNIISPQLPPSSFSNSQTRPANPLQTNPNGPKYPPSSSSVPNNLPPHLRPPGGSNGVQNNASSTLTNGGISEQSANSSRTASPAFQVTPGAAPPMQNYQSQAKLQQESAPFAPLSQQQQQHALKPVAPTSTAPPPSNIGALSGNMQNLNLNWQNGAQGIVQGQPQTTFVPATSGTAAPPNNFQARFKMNALSATQPQQQQQQTTTHNTPTVTHPAAMQQSFKQAPPATVNTSMPPLLNAPSISHISPHQNTNFMPTAAPPTANAFQQNQLNNNQPMQQSTPARPMYPVAGTSLPPRLPPPPPSGMQQQQPYAQAYQSQQPPISTQPPGLFNGQQNTSPLQYQNQQPIPQQLQQQQQQQQQQQPYGSAGSVLQQGFNRLWGQDTIDLMQNRHILTPNTLMPPKVVLHNQFQESVNCNPNIMRCTISKIPENNSLLQKSRLPLGVIIHPFRDINSLPVIQCPNIVRCRLCRTYINPFVYFVDSKMWKCNLCYRTNELPEDFQFDPATKTYGDVTRRPEVRSSTIEFIAPSEYMLRPPPPAMYLFLFDVSIIAQQCGYLENVCATLSKHLDSMPGDARTQIGFIAFNSQVYFYSMAEGYNQPHEMTLLDIDDPFLPRPDNLLVNLKECKELVKDLLEQLPKRFADTHDSGSALGAALQVAYKLMQASGGRVTVFQTCLPNKGPGALELREDPNNRSAKDIAHLNPATDFYKRYALDSSGYQIAVDLFLLNQQYSDLATISGISKHSGGCVHHFPLYQKTKPQYVESLMQCFKRYLTRKIGFEAVMRIRCTRGLQVHTFHGNFFVRSTDLLSLPNVNPDAGYGMQISYEESLSDVKTICFQAALLYTNSEGERRIRVHTLCLPVTASLPEVMHAADTEAIISLLSKMAVDRSLTSNVADAREAFLNATIDIFNAFKVAQNLPSGQSGQLIAPRSLALLPLYILALLKHRAFRVGISTRLDDRVFAMDCMKTLPLDQLMKYIYPEFYKIDCLFYNTQQPNAIANANANANTNTNFNSNEDDDEYNYLPEVPRLHLSAEHLDSRSLFLLDSGTLIILYVGLNVPSVTLEKVFGIKSTAELPDYYYGLPHVNSPENDALRRFMMRLNEDKPYVPTVQIIRDTSTAKPEFIEKLVDDRSESSLSYYEFLQHIRAQVK